MLFVETSVIHICSLIILQPPEVLNSILGQFEELANELWPNTTQDNNTNITDFRHERENGIEGIEGM